MTLYEGQIGKSYQVESIDIDRNIKRRLESIGLLEQTKVTIINRKRNGAMIIKLRGTRWAMGKAIVNGILIKEVA